MSFLRSTKKKNPPRPAWRNHPYETNRHAWLPPSVPDHDNSQPSGLDFAGAPHPPGPLAHHDPHRQLGVPACRVRGQGVVLASPYYLFAHVGKIRSAHGTFGKPIRLEYGEVKTLLEIGIDFHRHRGSTGYPHAMGAIKRRRRLIVEHTGHRPDKVKLGGVVVLHVLPELAGTKTS